MYATSSGSARSTLYACGERISSYASTGVSCARSTGSTAASTEASADTSPVRLSAQGLHQLAVQAFRTGNRGRLSLCEALRVLHETRLFFDLGFPSLAAYADAFFQLRRAETFEHVRVAKALVDLKELREAFGQGRIGWSALKAITRVAAVDSQGDWLDFARRNGVERTLAEARDALRSRRDTPRDGSFGLPNLDQKLVLRFSRSDMEKIRTWLEAGCALVTEATGADAVSLEQGILFLCEKDALCETDAAVENDALCETDAAVENDALCEHDAAVGTGGGRSASGTSHFGDAPCCAGQGSAARSKLNGPVADGAKTQNTRAAGVSRRARIVYQRCPDCRRARVGTRDGFVEVSSEEVERYEGSAEQVTIDGPTPARLRRRVLAREAGRCGNPRCGHLADHCHHIVFRSRGGKTDLANEVAVCTTCHALIHAGLLRVHGNAQEGGLRWSPVGCDGSLRREVASGRAVADRLPVLRLVTGPATREALLGGATESANADSAFRRAAERREASLDGPQESAIADSVLQRVAGRRKTNPGCPQKSANADSAREPVQRDDLAYGLIRLGVPAARSRRLIDAAVAAVAASPSSEITEANVLRMAMRSI